MGEDLPTIVLRKEWERRLGGGRFLWGINQSLGSSAQVAALRTGSLLALFSPAASRPRVADVKREDALVWNAWVDSSGQVRPLPQHVFVTSRTRFPSGKPRDHHYALVCASPTELSIGSSLRVQPGRLRSVGTAKAPCASQGTVVVDRVEPPKGTCGAERAAPRAGAQFGAAGYPVAFGVELEAPYFVRLAQPTRVKVRDMAALHEAARNADFEAWLELTKRLRGEAPAQHARGVTSDLFDLLAKARDLAALRSISSDTDFEACAEMARSRCGETSALLARGVTRELFARDLFDMAPAECTAPVRRRGGSRVSGASFGASPKANACGVQGDLLRGADWTQLTMELFHGDQHPFNRGRSRPTLS